MNIRRMLGVAALGAAATSLVLVPTAGAQEASYAGSSAGEALRLSVFGQGLTIGATLTEADSSPRAAAQGSGLATPAFEAGASSAAVEGSGQDGSTEEVCEGPIDQIPGISIGLACSSSVASVVDGNASAAATGTVGRIALNPVSQLLDTPLAEVTEPVQDGLGQLLDALEPVTGPVAENTGIDLDSTLRELIANLFEGADLVAITVGDTTATTTTTGETIVSECVAEGARIDVLGSEALGLTPVLTVIVGEAGTRVVADRATGEATSEVNPSLVTVRSPLLPGGEVAVPIGQSIEIPLPEPLGTSVISAAAGTAGPGEDGTHFAEASAVTIDLLNGEALQGGVELSLAACASTAGTTVPIVTPDEPAEPAAPILPTTGGEGPNTLALASALGLAGLGYALLRRTRATD
jgi:LPXTG-motif cell wall-anchored protein